MMLSVIIPVYQVEQTLDRCVRSVFDQQVADMEVILVDDGSPDRCPELCEAWSRRDSRVRVVHKQNGGLSDARNAGLSVAEGEYVTFVDSDDYLQTGVWHELLSRLAHCPEADMLEYEVEHEDASRLPLCLDDQVFGSARSYWLETRAWQHAYAWNKIYRRSLFESVRFPVGRFFEDLYTLPELLQHARLVLTVPVRGYHYSVNPEGISAVPSFRKNLHLLEAEIHAAWLMRTSPFDRKGRNLYYYMMCRLFDLVMSPFVR